MADGRVLVDGSAMRYRFTQEALNMATLDVYAMVPQRILE